MTRSITSFNQSHGKFMWTSWGKLRCWRKVRHRSQNGQKHWISIFLSCRVKPVNMLLRSTAEAVDIRDTGFKYLRCMKVLATLAMRTCRIAHVYLHVAGSNHQSSHMFQKLISTMCLHTIKICRKNQLRWCQIPKAHVTWPQPFVIFLWKPRVNSCFLPISKAVAHQLTELPIRRNLDDGMTDTFSNRKPQLFVSLGFEAKQFPIQGYNPRFEHTMADEDMMKYAKRCLAMMTFFHFVAGSWEEIGNNKHLRTCNLLPSI